MNRDGTQFPGTHRSGAMESSETEFLERLLAWCSKEGITAKWVEGDRPALHVGVRYSDSYVPAEIVASPLSVNSVVYGIDELPEPGTREVVLALIASLNLEVGMSK